MTYVLVASGATGFGTNAYTTSSIDTTGADFLIVCFGGDASVTPTVSDSKSNSGWTQASRYAPFQGSGNVWYCIPTSVGTGHTVTVTGTSQFGSGQFYAFTGGTSSPVDQSAGDLAAGTTTIAPGPITPGFNNELVFISVDFDNGTTVGTIDGGFSTPIGSLGSGGVYRGSSSSYLIQTTAATADPTFTKGGASANLYATIVSFKTAAAAAQDTPELYGRPRGLRGDRQMRQVLAQ